MQKIIDNVVSKILLDNDVISNLSNNEILLNKFIQKVQLQNDTVVISDLTIDEMLGGQKDEYAHRRFLAVNKIREYIGIKKFEIIREIIEIVHLERRFKSQVFGEYSVFYEKKDVEDVFKILCDQASLSYVKTKTSEHRKVLRKDSEHYKTLDEAFKKQALENKNGEFNQVESIIKDYKGLKDIPELYGIVSKLIIANSPVFNPGVFKKIDNSQVGYKLIKALILLIGFNILCKGLPNKLEDESLRKLSVAKLNDWIDLAVASTAVFCDFFISEDKDLAYKNNYLSSKGLLNFRTFNIEEYILSQQTSKN